MHPDKFSSPSDYCITTEIMWKHTKNAEKMTKSQKEGSDPYYTARTRFFPDIQFSQGGR